MTQELQNKVDRAIKLIQSASKIAMEHGQPIEVAYSGGKDSDVILELTKMANVPFRAIYKNTTIDPPGTIKHARSMGAEMVRPKKTFFELIQKNGMPTAYMRFCCSFLKEYKILDYAIIGIRGEESAKRAKRYKEPEVCRVFSKTQKVRQYLPILDWTKQDVEEFIKERNIKCAPVYYDDKNKFHVERRLGCMCCPLQGRAQRIHSFEEYPNMVKAYIHALKRFIVEHPNTSANKHFKNDVYAWFVHEVFYFGKNKEWNALTNGLLPPPNFKEYLENYFKIKFE